MHANLSAAFSSRVLSYIRSEDTKHAIGLLSDMRRLVLATGLRTRTPLELVYLLPKCTAWESLVKIRLLASAAD